MLIDYIHAAMRKAVYKFLSDDQTYVGEIPGFQGVWSNAPTIEGCREELQEVLEDWILFRVSRSLDVPVVEGMSIEIKKVG